MRSWCLGLLGAVLVSSTGLALETRPGLDPVAPPPVKQSVRTKAVNRTSADNEQAKRDESDRQKRWDDRMRRATRSMCDRC